MVPHRADREVQGSRHLGVRVTVREEPRDLDLTGRESARYEQPIGRIDRIDSDRTESPLGGPLLGPGSHGPRRYCLGAAARFQGPCLRTVVVDGV